MDFPSGAFASRTKALSAAALPLFFHLSFIEFALALSFFSSPPRGAAIFLSVGPVVARGAFLLAGSRSSGKGVLVDQEDYHSLENRRIHWPREKTFI